MDIEPIVLHNMLEGITESLLPRATAGEWLAVACTFVVFVGGMLFLPRRCQESGERVLRRLSRREVLSVLVTGLAYIGLVVLSGSVYRGCLCLAIPTLASLLFVRWALVRDADSARVTGWLLGLWACLVIAAPMAVLITCLARNLDCYVTGYLAAISLTSGLYGVIWAARDLWPAQLERTADVNQ